MIDDQQDLLPPNRHPETISHRFSFFPTRILVATTGHINKHQQPPSLISFRREQFRKIILAVTIKIF